MVLTLGLNDIFLAQSLPLTGDSAELHILEIILRKETSSVGGLKAQILSISQIHIGFFEVSPNIFFKIISRKKNKSGSYYK